VLQLNIRGRKLFLKKSLFFGTILLVVLILFSLVFQDYSLIVKIGVPIGLISIILAGFTTGVFQQRSIPSENYPLEDKSIRDIKTRWSTILFLFGLPSLVGAILTFILLK
jgi:hypothetical protein